MKEHLVKIKKLIWDDKEVKAFTLFGLALIFLLPLILKIPLGNWISYFDYTNTGQIGDTIGGITGPFINLLGAILVYVAFKEQVKANENQEVINKRQEEINKENDAEKVSNYIEDQISKLELYVLEDKFNLLEIASKYKNFGELYNKKPDRFDKIEYILSKGELSKVVFLQSMFISIIIELDSSKENNKKYLWQKIKLNYLEILISSSGYREIVGVLEAFDDSKKMFYSNTKFIEDTIIKTHKMIKDYLEKL